MNSFFNLSTNLILIKDLSDEIDFDLIRLEFDKLEFKQNLYNEISTDQEFFNKPAFKEIKEKLETECGEYLKNAYGANLFEKIEITNSWANKSAPAGSHQDHAHPFSIVSGVLYLDDNPDNLNFAMNTSFQEIPCYLYRKQTQATIKDLAGDGDNLKNHLLLILSNVGHQVFPSQTDTLRRTIAFNTFWKGYTGTVNDVLNSKVF
jgi:uncharacterized protein (TIGR02466 family)